MRVINSVEAGGVQYQAIWSTMSWIMGDLDGQDSRRALTIRNDTGENEAIIPHNAKLADVEVAIRHLRGLGLKLPQMAKLFNYKGDDKGLAKHVKVLVSRLRS